MHQMQHSNITLGSAWPGVLCLDNVLGHHIAPQKGIQMICNLVARQPCRLLHIPPCWHIPAHPSSRKNIHLLHCFYVAECDKYERHILKPSHCCCDIPRHWALILSVADPYLTYWVLVCRMEPTHAAEVTLPRFHCSSNPRDKAWVCNPHQDGRKSNFPQKHHVTLLRTRMQPRHSVYITSALSDAGQSGMMWWPPVAAVILITARENMCLWHFFCPFYTSQPPKPFSVERYHLRNEAGPARRPWLYAALALFSL